MGWRVCGWVLLGLAAMATMRAAEPRAVLFLPMKQPPPLHEQAVKEMKERGYLPAGHTSLQDLSLDYLKQFHAVVLTQSSGENQPVTPATRQGLATLREYVQEGGGLLVTKYLYSRRAKALFAELLEPLGAEELVEQILDDVNVYRQTRYNQTFAWTDRIAEHPVTAGVTGLAYNLNRWEPGEPGVLPIRVDDSWQVLIRGMPSAASFVPLPSTTKADATTGPGAYAESPPLLAARDYGKGRVVLWPTLMSFTLLDGYSMILEDGIVMDSQRGDRRSDGAKLTYNILEWITAPAAASDGFGGYVAPPPVKPPAELGFTAIDWSKYLEFEPAFAHNYKGLIGARTGLSTGTGTPAEFVAAAKAAGYDFIAFCEDVNAMSRENYENLVAACTEATTDDFLALPGYWYLDTNGNAFVVLAMDEYPPPEWADPKNPAKKILYNGTIRMAVKDIPPIILLPVPGNERPARYHSSFYGYAFQVWEDGKLVTENLDDYVELQREQLGLFPTAVHLVKSPAEVTAAAQQGMQAYVRADSLSALVASIDGFSSARYRWYKPGYPSSGPELCWFHAVNWGTTDLAIPGNDRLRLQMLVRSAKGLAEVKLYDNGRLIRRFALDGEKEFRHFLDLYHSQQHSLFMVVTDIDGGRAVSWDRRTNMQECWFIMCGDNMNDMGPGGKHGLDQGLVSLAGTECHVTPYGPSAVAPWPRLEANLADGTRLQNRVYDAGMKCIQLIDRFGMVIEYPLGYMWQDTGRVGAAFPAPFAEDPNLDGTYRYYWFVRRPPGPELEIRDYTITVKQDVELIGRPGLRLVSGHNWKVPEGSLDHLVSFTDDGGRVVETPAGTVAVAQLTRTVEPGEYAAVYPMCTAIFPLDQPLEVRLYRKNGNPGVTLVQAGLGQPGDKLAAGAVVRARFAVLTLPFAPEGEYSWLPEYRRYWGSNLVAERVREQMGLAGPPAYTVTPSVGSVADTRLALRVRTENHGFRAMISQCDLPIALPVFVEGLNPLWTAAAWYVGTGKFLRTEWPPGYHQQNPAHRRYVQIRTETDPLFRFGTFDDSVGYLQVDLNLADRDVFIGNPVVCDRADFPLVLHRDPGGPATVEVHNPTAAAADVVLTPAPGFDLCGDFRKAVAVPAGQSVIVSLE